MYKRLRKLASVVVWQLCRLLPLNRNKVVFCSAGGRGFGDNPKAIALALLETAPGLDLVWLTRDVRTPLPKGIRPCAYGSPRAVIELSTAAVWVNDSRGGAKYKRPEQKYLQTWHGFALKHIERSAKNLPAAYVQQCKKDSQMIDLMVSGSEFMTRVFREDFWYDGEIRTLGSPRNDVFFRPNTCGEEIRRAYSLPEDRKLLLYAPTFRDDGETDCYGLDTEAVRKACQARFGGEWTVLMRLHPNIAALAPELLHCDGIGTVDVTSWPDMQQLLLGCDVLVTDYSSSMFDFALSGKPCVRFATDLQRYTETRGFYFPMEALPFPLARNNEELCRLLQDFDLAAYEAGWARFRLENGFREDGGAARRCALWILQHTKGGNAE